MSKIILNIDDPEVTINRIAIINSKKFLKRIYLEWYSLLAGSLPEINGKLLELGSGAGFLKTILPDLISTEVFFYHNADLIMDGRYFPVSDESMRAILMTDVFHHIPDAHLFFHEVLRVLKPGGRICMIEPWVSSWSKWIMQNFHQEPMDINVEEWSFPSKGPLSSSNQALPWLVFERDLLKFQSTYDDFKILKIEKFMPFRYILSGGVSRPSLMPSFLFNFWQNFEQLFNMKKWAMFALIVLEKK